MSINASVVTSTGNRIVKEFKELHRSRIRRQKNRTIIEGPTVFSVFVDNGVTPVSVIAHQSDRATIDICSRSQIPLTLASEHVVHAAGGTVTTPGPVAIIDIPAAATLQRSNTLVLVDISDPGNVGTMIRTAAAFGWDVAYAGATADPWAPKTIRAATGAHVYTRLVPLPQDLAPIQETDLAIVASIVKDGDRPARSTDPVALLIGSEAHGLPDWALGPDVTSVSIDMPGGVESLNAAIAAGILVHQLS